MKVTAFRYIRNGKQEVELLISGTWVKFSPPKSPKEVTNGKIGTGGAGYGVGGKRP